MCYDDITLPKTLDALVVSLCGDYFRMREAAAGKGVSYRTLMEYRYYNFKIYDAAAEIVGEREAEIYIKEIGSRIGYAYSKIDENCEVTYKKKKKQVKISIARKLHLIDNFFLSPDSDKFFH